MRSGRVLLAFLCASAAAHADTPPAAPNDDTTRAAEEFEAARFAYRAGEFASAAMRFEEAYGLVPRAEVLRLAIRAELQAAHFARAATLAAHAEAKYSSDTSTHELASGTLDKLSPKLREVTITCDSACQVIVAGWRANIGHERAPHIFTDADTTEVAVECAAGDVHRFELQGGAGSSEQFAAHCEAQAIVSSVPTPTPTPAPAQASTPESMPARHPAADVAASTKPLAPAWFIVLASTTAALGVATATSGIIAEYEPGRAAVRANCVGLGTSCTTYQEGVHAQERTNVLLGSTAGLGVVTAVVGLFLTDWSSGSTSPRASIELAPIATDRSYGLRISGLF